MAGEPELKGSCACGAIAFTLQGERRDAVACHCVSCRKQSGHYIAATRVSFSDFKVVSGETHLRWWDATEHARRGFCDTCGSLLFWRRRGSEYISVFTGSLDGDTGLKLISHIYTGEKGDYYEITDGLPQFPGPD